MSNLSETQFVEKLRGEPWEQAIFDAAHWRKRADETRAYAEQMEERSARERMHQIARKYELLAKRAEVHGTARLSRGKARTSSKGRGPLWRGFSFDGTGAHARKIARLH
jgi:hypothetical protein